MLKFKDLKYLLAYLTPLIAWWGFSAGGIWSFGSAYWAFLLIPFIELFVPASKENMSASEYARRERSWIFDVLLYLNVPIVYFLLYVYCQQMSAAPSLLEMVGMTINMGVVLGSLGINVAHELGHRSSVGERGMALALLLPSAYLHFYIEHNRGHHKYVATERDPATARKGESVYAFWIRSLYQTYRHAWLLEKQRLQTGTGGVNLMWIYTLVQIAYWTLIAVLWSWQVMLLAMLAGLVGALLLECVNYIEHYGLLRRKISEHRYEPVQQWHSWNSNHELGRIVLYELVRHSDHHMKSQRPYQSLRCIDASPQLPYGYPGSILLSMIPALWFTVIDKRIPATTHV